MNPGLVGLFGFLIFILYLFKKGIGVCRSLPYKREKEELVIFMCGLGGLLVNMAGYDLFYWHNPFVLFCILCGIIASLSSSLEEAKTV